MPHIEIYSFEWGIVLSLRSSFSQNHLKELSFYCYVSFHMRIMLENTIKTGIYIIYKILRLFVIDGTEIKETHYRSKPCSILQT